MQSIIDDMDLPAINLLESDDNNRHGIECRSTEITGEILGSPQQGPATNPSIVGLQSSRDGRPYCGNDIVDDECIINRNRNVTSVKPTNNQIHLFDELELLRTENFQLRLRIYNAEQRVNRLSSVALGRDQKKRSVSIDTDSDGMDTDSDGTDTDSDGMDTDSDGMDTDSDGMDTDSDGMDTDSEETDNTDDSNGHAGSGTDQKAKTAKTAKAAVRSIHDLLALNRRLLALMAATMSAESASVSADDKRRWQQLRSHIEEYTVDSPNEEKKNEDDDDNDDDEFYDASATDTETLSNETGQNVPRSPTLPSSTPLKTVGMDDKGVGSDVTSLRGQCRPLQSTQMLMKMDLWVPKRKFGKLEQKRCMTQVAEPRSSHTGSGTGQNAKAKVTTEATVHTIHDLLTLNQKLLTLMADTVLSKSVSVSAGNKRRLHQLQSHIEEYAIDSRNKETTAKVDDDDDDSDDEFFDACATNSGTLCKAWLVSTDHSVMRQNVLRSPPPPPPQLPQSSPSRSLEIVDINNEGVGSEVTRLEGQCRPIRSVHQLMKTELWARNRNIFGRFEQQQIMTQVSYAGVHIDRRPVKKAVTAAVTTPPQPHHLQQFRTKKLALTTSPSVPSNAKAPCTAKALGAACTESQTGAASTPLTVAAIATHPLVFPDYSDVNFFISCGEEEDDDDDDDDDEDFEETNCTSSSEEETADWNDCGEEPVLSPSTGARVALSTSTRIHCRTHRAIKSVGNSATFAMTTSSPTESEAAEIDANELNDDGIITTETIATSPCSTVRVGNDLNKRRRCMLPRRCSSGGVDAANRPRPSSVVDAQVQCDGGNVVADHILSSSDHGVDDQLQLQQLHRELDVRRRDNSRLNDMLLRFQQALRPGDSDPGIPPSSVHGSIANLLPPLLSAEDDDVGGGDGDHQRCQLNGVEQQLQLQLTRIRKRILGDEHQILDSGEDREDPFNDAVRCMDHADLINVALPQVVERLHRALVLLQHRPENVAAK